MRARSLNLALVLCVVLLTATPVPSTTIGRERPVLTNGAMFQNGLTRWSPFGPWMYNMVINIYQDPLVMLTALQAGEIDITDWPILRTSDLASIWSYSDYFATSAAPEFGLTDLEINSHPAMMGIPLNTPRSTGPASFATSASVTACATGVGSLTISLVNQETGQTILDQLNTLTVSTGTPPVSTTVSDSGGANPTGLYNIPCISSGTYSLTASVYTGTATATITSNTNTVGTFNVNWNSLSSVRPTSQRSMWAAALAHMFDKPSFVNGLQGPAVMTDIMAPPAQGLPQPTIAQTNVAECQFNNHPWLNVCNGTANDASAYNIVNDNIIGGSEWWQFGGPTGYSGQADLRAACDNLVSMGLLVTPSTANCNDVANAAAGTTPPPVYPHLVPNGNIVYYIGTLPGVREFGLIIADTLNFLFGTPSSMGGGTVCYGPCPNATPKYYDTGHLAPIITGDGNTPDSWQLYTGDLSLTPTPDNLYRSDSLFTGGVCAGTTSQFFSNYAFYCNPQYDTDVAAGEISTPYPRALQFFSRAALDGMMSGLDVPVFSRIDTFVENSGWNFQQCTGTPCVNTQSSIVNTFGQGTRQGFWTLLNGRQVPGYNPCTVPMPDPNCSLLAPGGGSSTLIRRGFSQNITYLNPFLSSSPWEIDAIRQIFDSMLAENPLTGPSNAQILEWQTSTPTAGLVAGNGHAAYYDPNEISCTANGCTKGTVTWRWHLRNDLKFQDGNPVTANDVTYTILAYRDVPAAYFQPLVENVASAVARDCAVGAACHTVDVKVQGNSTFNELGIGSLPILEKSVWAPYCGDPPAPGSTCGRSSFDPMALGIMIGDGPWSCIVPPSFPNAGHVGGPCTLTPTGGLAGQSLIPGGRILLTRFQNYFRCCPDDTTSGLYKLSWADKDNKGVVDTNNLAGPDSPRFYFGQANSYWVNPNIAPGTTVNISDLAEVAIYLYHGTTYPFLYDPSPGARNQLIGLDPQIDPFFCPNTGC